MSKRPVLEGAFLLPEACLVNQNRTSIKRFRGIWYVHYIYYLQGKHGVITPTSLCTTDRHFISKTLRKSAFSHMFSAWCPSRAHYSPKHNSSSNYYACPITTDNAIFPSPLGLLRLNSWHVDAVFNNQRVRRMPNPSTQLAHDPVTPAMLHPLGGIKVCLFSLWARNLPSTEYFNVRRSAIGVTIKWWFSTQTGHNGKAIHPSPRSDIKTCYNLSSPSI
jgi:hypothetical protein